MSPQGVNSTVPFATRLESSNHTPGLSATINTYQARESPAPRTGTQSKNTTPCRCIGVTLTLLEKIQSHSKVTSFCMAEKSLHSLKRSISQCQAISNCHSCRNPSRVMTFSILLVEKIMSILEDIASVWESSTLATGADQNTAQLEIYGHGHSWVPVSLGQYKIDTVQERCEVFGLLIILQARHLGSLLETLGFHAKRERWESHQSALRPLALRIRELKEALSGTPSHPISTYM